MKNEAATVIILTSLLILFTPLFASGQNAFKKLPESLNRPFSNEVYNYRYKDGYVPSLYGYDWRIYATIPLQGFRFMEEFRVIRVKSGANDQYTIETLDGRRLTTDHTNLLIHHQALYDPETGFKMKGLPISSIQSVKRKIQLGQEDKITFWKDPEMKKLNFEEAASKGLGIWFVYKIDSLNKSLLLGRSSEINDNAEKLFGWVRMDEILLWNQRIVLQPNQDSVAIRERSDKQIKIGAFIDEETAESFFDNSNLSKTRNIIHPNKASQYNRELMSSQEVRWPIINPRVLKNETNVYKIGLVGNPRKSGDTLRYDYDQTTIDFARKKLEMYRERAENIDIVFVLDRTKSMRDYILQVKEVLDNLLTGLTESSEGKGNQYRFGAVAYTDSSEGEDETLLHPIGTKRDISVFLQTLPIIDNNDKTNREALFNGLLAGARLLTDTTHTNFIIHIGDAAGNDETRYRSDLLRLMHKSEISLISIQINNKLSRAGKYDESYQDFQTQIRDLAYENIKSILKDIEAETPEELFQDFLAKSDAESRLFQVDFKYSDKYSTTTVITDKSKSPVLGIIKTAHPGRSLNHRELPEMIKDFIFRIEETRKGIFADIDFSQNVGLDGVTYKASVLNEINEAGMTEEEKAEWLNKRYTTLIEAYVSFRVKEAKYPLLEFALFMDESEYNDLEYALTHLSANPTPANRQVMKRTWLSILKSYVEPTTNLPISDTLRINTALKEIVGIVPQNQILSKYSLKDIGESDALNDQEFLNAMYEIAEYGEYLSSIKQEYSFTINGQRYYWIPRSFLP